MTQQIINKVYSKYKKSVNMSYSDLLSWSQNKCSKKASLNREPIKRNLKLLNIKRVNWTIQDAKQANKTIAFIARMRKVPRGEIVCGKYSKRDISLKNWAFDPFKK